MNNGNGTVKWVAIIISVVIAMVSLSIGVIRTSNAEKITELKQEMQRHEELIAKQKEANTQMEIRMRESNARTEEQMKNVKKQLDELNKKMDIVLERLGK